MDSHYGVGISNRFSKFLIIDSDDEEEDGKEKVEVLTVKNKKDNRTGKEINKKTGGAGEGAKKPAPPAEKVKQKENQKRKEVVAPVDDGSERYVDPNPDDWIVKNKNKAEDDTGKETNKKGGKKVVEKEIRKQEDDEWACWDTAYVENIDPVPKVSKWNAGGGGGGRAGPRDGPIRKREFDRHSASDKSGGMKQVDKRDGGGSRNWGTYKDEIEQPAEYSPFENIPEEKPDNFGFGQFTPEEGSIPDVTIPIEEEPVKLMTLAEYKALQTSQPREKPVFNVRKAGEGEDQSWMQKMRLVKKVDQKSDEEAEEEEDKDAKRGRQKHLLDIEFQFSDSRRGFGAARGRGGPRGGGGDRGFSKTFRTRNYNVDDRQFRQVAPKVDSDRDFPSL